MVGASQGSVGAPGIWPVAAELLAYSGLSAPSSHNPQTAFDSPQLERQKCLFRFLPLSGSLAFGRRIVGSFWVVAAPAEKKKGSPLL